MSTSRGRHAREMLCTRAESNGPNAMVQLEKVRRWLLMAKTIPRRLQNSTGKKQPQHNWHPLQQLCTKSAAKLPTLDPAEPSTQRTPMVVMSYSQCLSLMAGLLRHKGHRHQKVLHGSIDPLEACLIMNRLGQALGFLDKVLCAIFHNLGLYVGPQRLPPGRELLLEQRGGIPHIFCHYQVLLKGG